MAKKVNKNSSKRIGSKTNWLSMTKSNTVDALNSNTFNSSNHKSNENSNSNENTGENKAEMFETLENHREGTVIERLRRSLVERSNHVGEQVPPSQRFNRHPNLSYEERQKQLNHTMQPRDRNQNFGTATMYKRPDKFESPSSKETNKRSYVSVFSNCDDTQHFEANDSNGNRERDFKGSDSDGEKDLSGSFRKIENLRSDKNVSNKVSRDVNRSRGTIKQKKNKNITVTDRSNSENDLSQWREIENLQNDKNALNVTFRDVDKLPSSIKKEKEDKNYIDIRDHQRNVENFNTSSDRIPEYDPNKIPYVEVPDYSDIREEYLDEEDRKVNEQKKMETDFVDPEVSTDFEEPPEKESSSNDSSGETLEIKPLKTSKESSSEESNSSSHEMDKSKANGSNSNVLNNMKRFPSAETLGEDTSDETDSDMTNFNRFPNAGQRDRNDEYKSLESLRFGQSSEREPSNSVFDESFEFFELEQEDERELVPTEDSKANLNNAKSLEEQESEETSREDSTRARQGDPESQSGPIIFEHTNEYRKPFDLDEFLKDDPIMKKLTPLEKERRTNYGENGKRVPSDFNEYESDNATFRVRMNSAQHRDTFDDLPKSYESSDLADTFARIDERIREKEEDGDDDFTRLFRDDEKDFGRRENNYNRDEETENEREKENTRKEDSNEGNSDGDFLKFNIKGDKIKADKIKRNKGYKIEENRRNTRNRNSDEFRDFSKIFERQEEDVPTGYENEDIGNLHKDAKNHGTKNTRGKEDARDALSTISSRNSQVSRLDDDQRIKDRDAIGYGNFWSLEHKSPVTRVDMEAQERRK